MKRIIIYSLLTIFSLTFLPSCQNNGDIGPWYGMWKLTSLTIDGEEDPAYEGNVFWKFQTGVVQMIGTTIIPELAQVRGKKSPAHWN